MAWLGAGEVGRGLVGLGKPWLGAARRGTAWHGITGERGIVELTAFLDRLEAVAPYGAGQYAARCPAHPDNRPSLTLREADHGGIVLHCKAGCSTEHVVAAMGLSMADLAGAPYVVASYAYHGPDGEVRYTVQRWANPKDFRCVPGLPAPAQRVPYNLAAIAWARANGVAVYVVEGEKDCDRLAAIGIPATCNVGGAGKWLDHYSDYLAGCHVIVVADNDPPGKAHARMVAYSLARVTTDVLVAVPRYGKDVSDLLDAGYELDATLDPLPEDEALGAVLARNVTITSVAWAWPGYIPLGKVSMLEGDPGDGKSILSVDLVARFSSGAPMPDGTTHGGPWDAVMITSEDDLGDTIVPRLRAAGADLGRVHLITHGSDQALPFDATSPDMDALRGLVRRTGARVVTLDPLMASVGASADTHNDRDVRRALFPLYRLAMDLGVAVVLVRHLNKGAGGRAIYRGGGSIAFIGAARCAYTIGRDADDRDRRIMACVKMNIAPEPPSLAYAIRNGRSGPFIEWLGPVDVTAQGVVDGDSRAAGGEIIDFLNSVVQNGKPMKWTEIVRLGREDGYTEKQLRSRRDRSRLVKIIGSEGARSAMWGYLEHQLAADAASPTVTGHLPLGSHLPYPGAKASGNGKASGPSTDSEIPGLSTGEPAPVDIDDDAREEALRALPLECDVCGTDSGVGRFMEPYWVIRCGRHNPMKYHE